MPTTSTCDNPRRSTASRSAAGLLGAALLAACAGGGDAVGGQSAALSAAEQPLIGHLDAFDYATGRVRGWACDAQSPDAWSPGQVNLHRDGKYFWSFGTREERTDTVEAFPEHCRGARSGFDFPLSTALQANVTHTIQLFSAPVSHDESRRPVALSTADIANNPFTLRYDSNHRPSGHIDSISPGGVVRGWACDPDQPDRPVQVHFRFGTPLPAWLDMRDGSFGTAGAVETGLARPDVAENTLCGEASGFAFRLPREIGLMGVPTNGEVVSAQVRDYATQPGVPLVGVATLHGSVTVPDTFVDEPEPPSPRNNPTTIEECGRWLGKCATDFNQPIYSLTDHCLRKDYADFCGREQVLTCQRLRKENGDSWSRICDQ